MSRNLIHLGQARVYRDPRTGEIIVDEDTLRRSSFSGDDFGDEDDDFGDEDDDFGDEDDDFEGEDDDFEGEDDDFEGEDDDFEGEPDTEVGRRRGRRKKGKRGRGRSGGRGRSRGRGGKGRGRGGRSSGQRKESGMSSARAKGGDKKWGMTAVSGTDTLTAQTGGSATVRVRLQHDFKAQDLTFEGSASGAKVTSIFFGDQSVWSNPDGIPVSVFGSSSFLRGLLKGQRLRAGLDIVVNGVLTSAGDFAVTITGAKPIGK